jgi:hypothetical protein
MNTLKTTFLMALLTVLLVTAGGAMGGEGGMMLTFLFALIMNGISYWFSDKIVLRMYGAKEIGADEAPTLHRIIRDLTLRAQIPMPKLYLIPQEAPNAFATGRDEKHAKGLPGQRDRSEGQRNLHLSEYCNKERSKRNQHQVAQPACHARKGACIKSGGESCHIKSSFLVVELLCNTGMFKKMLVQGCGSPASKIQKQSFCTS